MYKVFCDNHRLGLFYNTENSLNVIGKNHLYSTLKEALAKINFWLKMLHKTDLDLFVEGSDSCESLLRRVFNWRCAAGGVVLIDNKILTILRNGIPDLPKGHIDFAETPEDAAIREVCEETGITKPEIIGELPTTYHCYQLDNSWILKKTYWFFMQSKADFVPRPQLDEGISAVRLLTEKEFDAFFTATFRSINEGLANAVKQKYKALKSKTGI